MFAESMLDDVAFAELGVQMSWDVFDSRRELVTGRNRSLVRSKISDPIAPIAVEYRSRRILDSLTIKSAKRRTRSASDWAADS